VALFVVVCSGVEWPSGVSATYCRACAPRYAAQVPLEVWYCPGSERGPCIPSSLTKPACTALCSCCCFAVLLLAIYKH
jgi:hypothetical protein